MDELKIITVVLSWVGATILLIRALPQACKSWREGHSNGLAPSMLWLWLIGSFCILPHLLMQQDWATSMIYFSNIAAVTVMIKYFYFPRETKNKGD